jgi:hypothetical protein
MYSTYFWPGVIARQKTGRASTCLAELRSRRLLGKSLDPFPPFSCLFPAWSRAFLCGVVSCGYEIPQAANRVVGSVGRCLPAADRTVGAELLAC